jgi:hypothetical protein
MATNYNTKYANLQKLAAGLEDTIAGFVNSLDFIPANIRAYATPANIAAAIAKAKEYAGPATAAMQQYLNSAYTTKRSPNAGLPKRAPVVGFDTYSNVMQYPTSQRFNPAIQNTGQFVDAIEPIKDIPVSQQRILAMNRPQARSGPVPDVIPKAKSTTPATPAAPVV